jgi:hypothetical protein
MTVSIKHSTPADGSFSATGATAWNADHTLTGVGTMAEQDANNVAITGGSISGVTGVGTVTSVTGTSPIVSSGGTTPAISMAAATTSVNGYLTSTDWNTFNNKGSGTVTSVGGAGTVSGLTLTGTITNSGNLTLGGAITGFATSGANTNLTSVALTTGTISTAPSSSTDIVNKSYADSIASGVNFHAAAQYGTTAALAANTYNNGSSGVGATLTAVAVGTLTIDGYTLVIGDVGKRLLIKNEATQANNGVYTLTQAGTAVLPYILTRATDYDTSGSGTNEVDQGDLILVINGTTNANTSWVQQTPLPITIGTTAIVFIQFAAIQTYTAGTGLSLTTNQFSISNTGTAGTYGAAATVPVITTNAQGQVTSVTNTAIAISGGAVSGNIAGSAGSVINALTAGTNITFSSGTTYDGSTAITINATGGGGGMVYPGSGIPNSTGSAWGTSYSTTGSGTVVALATSPTFVTPILGTPQSGNFSTGTFTWPTFNQNTTGSAGSVANALTAGTGVTFSSGTTYDGSAAKTINAAATLAKNNQVFTSGSGTYTAPANTQWVKVTVVGPGGNGGAATSAKGAGGGGGAVVIKGLAMTAGQTLLYTVGTSGTGSIVQSGTLTITALQAGTGSNGGTTTYAVGIGTGGSGGSALGGDLNIAGGNGGYSYGSSTTIATQLSGYGGNCPGFGSGGSPVGGAIFAGTSGSGYGGGGGGSIGSATAGTGAPGVIIFEAY